MTRKELADYLKGVNEYRRYTGDDIHLLAAPNPTEYGAALDEAIRELRRCCANCVHAINLDDSDTIENERMYVCEEDMHMRNPFFHCANHQYHEEAN